MWSQVTLNQFHQLSHIERGDALPFEKTIARLKVLGIEPDTSSLIALNNQIPEWVNTLPSGEVKLTYIIKGEEYHPHLNFTTMNTSRFLDIYHQIKDKDPQDVSEWTYLLSLCLSKHGEPYDYKTHFDRAQMLYDHMTFDQAYPLVVFFSKVWNSLQEIILDSSMERLNTLQKELMESFKESIESSPITGAGLATSQK